MPWQGADGDFTKDNRLGRNINYGVREHAMGAITNGLVLHHIRSITGGFFVFSDYMKPAIRLASLMKIPSIFVFTHDSIAVGEDGPTHEPIEQAIEDLKMDKDLATRYVNESFSGGEKKKNEILQMKMLEPKIAILDEIDSGLDVDAVKIVSDNVNELKEKNGMGLMVISHYRRLFEYIKPDRVIVIINGVIAKEGDSTLLDYIDSNGFDSIKKEIGLVDEVTLLETCAFKR